ncbi:hypothetical protein [Allocoleopsis franciscana]|uniref:Uncharacterized protein n=1 Tax=Allocoleopsis franciscana PCC 7113 TaxID=1173027 RepID=K9WM98_9CYAN|nr:hypothetical protein [Allocoleopsis franciscana]AFZ21530.1 hypothetical protein Mic7113_5926 [Allocoleopsis franciscana PCC 7113]
MNSLEPLNLYGLDGEFLNQSSAKEVKLVKAGSEATQSSFEIQNDSSELMPLFYLFILLLIVIFVERIGGKFFRKTTKVKTNAQLKPLPCESCRFFIDNPHLKCAVHPAKALTPLALNCQDYHPDSIAFPKNKARFTSSKVDE